MKVERGQTMFGQLYGNYLMKKDLISKEQFEETIQHLKSVRVKLGLIAVAEKLITTEQAEELNHLQAKMDKRFGDIAVEKGYLTTDQVTHLLSLQGNPYLSFVQTITEKGFLSMGELEANLLSFQKENDFTDSDLEALKNGDTDSIVSIFTKHTSSMCEEITALAVRNLIRFINTEVYMEKAYSVTEYPFEHLASQSLDGNHNVFVGFSGKGNSLLSIANPYAKEEFSTVDEDAFDAVCEFLNCINGLFASKLSHEDIELDMLPPLFYSNQTVSSKGSITLIPMIIGGTKVELVISIDGELTIQ